MRSVLWPYNRANSQSLLKVTDRRQARPLVREGAPQRQRSNVQTEYNIWLRVPE
jgi:hypothetical protein